MSVTESSSAHPFVRVVILAFDGADMTLECIESVLNCGWPQDRLEVVLVDNGSLDDVVSRTRASFPSVKIIEPLRNTGFAGGCNLGISALASSDGTRLRTFDYVALVNNDATVMRGWLEPLVEEMSSSADIGAVSPKILLAHRFIDIEVSRLYPDSPLRESEPVCISGFRVGGERIDRLLAFDEGFSGPSAYSPANGDEFARWTVNGGSVRLVADDLDGPIEVGMRIGARVAGWVKIRSDLEEIQVRVGAGEDVGPNGHRWIGFDVGSERVDVINNAGSELYADGSAGDRGFLERDRGQFDEPADVAAWCGGAVLLRKEYLDAVGLFDESLFLYYEDTDLSWRGRLQGWRYRYAPRSVVRHRHAQSSGAGSELFRFQVERNRLLLLAKNAPLRVFLRSAAGEFRRYAGSLIGDVLRPLLLLRRPLRTNFRFRHRVLRSYLTLLPRTLGQRWLIDRRVSRRRVMNSTVEKQIRTPVFDDQIAPKVSGTGPSEVRRPRAAVYNLYWDTYGGGEMVSGEIARVLESRYDVTLLGPDRPNATMFSERLGIDLSAMDWRCVTDDDAASALSANFDLFVNCTYLSSALNRSPKGLYYVHFPGEVRSSAVMAGIRWGLRGASILARIPLMKSKAGRVSAVLAERLPRTDWTDSYSLFIANSAYTQTWIQRIWGQSSTVVHPPVQVSVVPSDKGPVIASVGRFFDPIRGHSKKQLELVRAFEAMCRDHSGVGPWRLVLVGGADAANRDYVLDIRRSAEGLPVDIHVNASRDTVESVLSKAEIYWHAGGFGEDENKHPERFEHFGISVVEAMAAGAVPVVFGAAGPAEIVRHGVDGFHWRTLEELRNCTRRLIEDPELRAAMSTNARARVDEFSRERFAAGVLHSIDSIID